MADWFRRTTWSSQDRTEFFDRWKRARSVHTKAQYLRIQAVHLQETGEPACIRAALELLELMISSYPETAGLAQAHKQRAECLLVFGERDQALIAYRNALDAERAARQITSGAYLGFGELVLVLGRDDLYREVLAVLDHFGAEEPFPIQRYRSFAIRALTHERLGNEQEARRCAEHALTAAAETQSPFRYHRDLGLVTVVDEPTHVHLLALAGRTH